jgi:hypothetical protein
MRNIAIAGALLVCLASTAEAQSLNFDQAAYITCREANAMTPDARKALAISLAEHAARTRGVIVPDDQRGGQLALLVRGGCTLAPDAYLFTVIDRAILAEKDKLPKR